jgi:hypothetical protein
MNALHGLSTSTLNSKLARAAAGKFFGRGCS